MRISPAVASSTELRFSPISSLLGLKRPGIEEHDRCEDHADDGDPDEEEKGRILHLLPFSVSVKAHEEADDNDDRQ